MTKFLVIFIASFLLIACSSSDAPTEVHQAVVYESSDECHVCGMVITGFSGPKGQAFETRTGQVKKFCSTIDLMFWYLQPENKPNVKEIYVHDMALSSWESPDDEHQISARNAIFVYGSGLKGSMGKTLASFSNNKDAESYVTEHGGKLARFNELNLELLAQ